MGVSVPPEFGEVETPMYNCPLRFHSRIVVDIPLRRVLSDRVILPTFDDTIGLIKVDMQFKLFKTSFNYYDLLENWSKLLLIYVICF
jgi:hypothetical protein